MRQGDLLKTQGFQLQNTIIFKKKRENSKITFWTFQVISNASGQFSEYLFIFGLKNTLLSDSSFYTCYCLFRKKNPPLVMHFPLEPFHEMINKKHVRPGSTTEIFQQRLCVATCNLNSNVFGINPEITSTTKSSSATLSRVALYEY